MNIDDLEGLGLVTLEELKKVTRINGLQLYALAQLEIGKISARNNEFNEALAAWNKIKHSDDSNIFSIAQLNIGNIFIENNDLEAALIAWGNIKRTYDAKTFGQAQFNIGLALLKNGESEKAILAWRNISNKDNAKMYSQAQFNIGLLLRGKDDVEGALSTWQNIDYEDNAKIYEQAQINIGSTLAESGDLRGGLSVWEKIELKNNPEIYALAQLNIGIALKENNDIKNALTAWNNVQSTYDLKAYSKAQLSIGIALEKKGEIEKALSIWVNNINHENDSKTYAKALIAISNTLEENYGIESALKVLGQVDINDCPEMFASAQYRIGLYLLNDNGKKKYSDAKKAFDNANLAYPYEAYCYGKICDLLSNSKTEVIGKKILKLFDRALNIVDILKLDFEWNSYEAKAPERKLAHYTGTNTVNLLLENDEEKCLPSAFRLNTINNVNDPSEGQLLLNYLKDIKEQSFHAPDFDDRLHAFIGCFTLNHDSLNQFRLYGKQDNKEASGISLVFNREFFQSSDSLKGLSYLSPKNNLQGIDEQFANQKIDDEKAIIHSPNIRYRVSKQPVMRCIYLDPISNFTQLAQRNKLTFYREFGIEKTKAKLEWTKYTNEIQKKTKTFNREFKYLKKAYRKVIKEKVRKSDKKILDEIEILLSEALLPLKYLIKHSAFQEEQECRMIYIISLNRPEVKMDFGKFLYVEYEPEVKSHLDKIYIAPAATQFQPYLAKLLCDTDIKIELSNNPYRHT